MRPSGEKSGHFRMIPCQEFWTLPIGYDTWIAVSPRPDRTVRLHSMNLDADNSFSLDCLIADICDATSRRELAGSVRGLCFAITQTQPGV